MAVLIACLLLFLTMTGHSDAAYCVCSQQASEAQMQKNIDYACGAGADCTPILQNGPCYNPNTLRDHCNWAVNSYYQKKGQTDQSCNFANSASVSQTPPTTSSGSCVYPSSPGNAGTSPTTNPSTGGTTGTNPTGSPTIGAGGTTTTAPGGTTANTPNFGGLGPSGSGLGSSTDGSKAVALYHNFFTSLAPTLLLIGLICLRV